MLRTCIQRTLGILVILAVAATAQAARDVNVVVGEMPVGETNGARIAGARVCLGLSSGSSAEGYAVTDVMGVARFENVPRGSRTYYLSVVANGRTGAVRTFQVQEDYSGGMAPQRVNVTLPGNGATCTPPDGQEDPGEPAEPGEDPNDPADGRPEAPRLQFPRDGATKNRPNVTFMWRHPFQDEAMDPAFDREEHHFRVCVARPGEPCNQGDSEQCSFATVPTIYAVGSRAGYWGGNGLVVPVLLRGQPVEWSVGACNAHGCRWSERRSLTVSGPLNLSANSTQRLYACRECRRGAMVGRSWNRGRCAQRIPRADWIDQSGTGGSGTPPSNDPEGAIAAFNEIASIFHHPRCTNCHVDGRTPRQGDSRIAHEADRRNIRPTRGDRCTDCHSSNPTRRGYENAPVPPTGPQSWHLAPVSMTFEDPSVMGGLKLPGDLCRSIKAAAGSPQAVVAHVTGDNLVQWAFAPGGGLVPAHSAGHGYFTDKLAQWARKGGACPP
ncbi:MAG: hypothetical protein P8R42_23115 [Candidatus Binatia bacterium]|nr:hypothetical protein [Candidatus Binatia bacterium]